MDTLKAGMQATAARLHLHAEECFQRAAEHHRSADAQHANAKKLEVLGAALEADAAQLFGETQLNAVCPGRERA